MPWWARSSLLAWLHVVVQAELQATLGQLLTPPSAAAVASATTNLSAMGALDAGARASGGCQLVAGEGAALSGAGRRAHLVQYSEPCSMRPAGEQLTALGTHVASMPMDPRLAKALIYACMLR